MSRKSPRGRGSAPADVDVVLQLNSVDEQLGIVFERREDGLPYVRAVTDDGAAARHSLPVPAVIVSVGGVHCQTGEQLRAQIGALRAEGAMAIPLVLRPLTAEDSRTVAVNPNDPTSLEYYRKRRDQGAAAARKSSQPPRTRAPRLSGNPFSFAGGGVNREDSEDLSPSFHRGNSSDSSPRPGHWPARGRRRSWDPERRDSEATAPPRPGMEDGPVEDAGFSGGSPGPLHRMQGLPPPVPPPPTRWAGGWQGFAGARTSPQHAALQPGRSPQQPQRFAGRGIDLHSGVDWERVQMEAPPLAARRVV
eukprot:TRINITY_DN12193_c0_g1_i1.p1 TRINITY_DN12193_c0_g1~~TRINITY_DN12193_c0_g1_i1.p1  ORF type:complete len:333 (+),score=30.27 TRINITY_DN12193_c0_g1_i1:83-1000(+)